MESKTPPSGLVVMSLRIHRQRLQKSLLHWLNRAQAEATVSAKTFCRTNKQTRPLLWFLEMAAGPFPSYHVHCGPVQFNEAHLSVAKVRPAN